MLMFNPQLETFICVADAGSFNKAAEELYITPPAVIKQINLLEAELDVSLFVRTHRGLKITEAGRSLYKDAKYIIQYCKESVIRAKQAAPTGWNTIRIGTSPITPVAWLVELWPKVQKQCPDMNFKMVPFDNTPENAREILANLGTNIDVVAGIFDQSTLDYRKCNGLELYKVPICCAVSIHHPLASKDRLTIQDLDGENLFIMRRGWSHYVDLLRDNLWENHPKINLIDFSFYNVEIFNQCENTNDVLLAIEDWAPVHPLLKIIPVEWSYTIPFGILHSDQPSDAVKRFLAAVTAVLNE